MSFDVRKRVGAASALLALAVVGAAGSSAPAQAPAPVGASDCPVAPDPAALPSAARLKQMNSFVAKLGARPTGSRSHARYIAWIRRQLSGVPGLRTSDL